MNGYKNKISLPVFFTFANYSLILVGFLAFAQSDILPVFLELPLAALLFSLFLLEIRGTIPIYTDNRFGAIQLMSVLLIILLYKLGFGLFDLAGYLIVGYLFLRIIYKKDLSDYLLCYFLSLILVVIGAISSVELYFIFIFLGFFLNITWCLILYHLRVEGDQEVKNTNSSDHFAPVLPKKHHEELIGLPFLAGTSMLVLITFFMTLLIFFFFPRMSGSFFQLKGSANRFVTSGFGNEVTLGEIGEILENEAVTFRAVITKDNKVIKLKEGPYWRGLSLDYYDGKKWTNKSKVKLHMAKVYGNIFLGTKPKNSTEIVKQEVFMETVTSSNVLFLLGPPLRFHGPQFRTVNRDEQQNYRFFPSPFGKYRYSAEVDISENNRNQVIPASKNGQENPFLQLPPVSKKLAELAKELAGSGNHLEKATNIESALKSNYNYSLKMTYENGMPPVEYFLFKSKEGHCEYFATAMALLLRLNNIPARITNGFCGGEWNETGKYYIVRERDAHSWVEAYIDGSGWAIFDPTPPIRFAIPDSWRSSLLFQYIDYTKLVWDRYIINYSRKDQVNALKTLATLANKEFEFKIRLRSTFARMKRTFNVWRHNTPFAPFWVACILSGCVFLILTGRKNWTYFTKREKYGSHRGAVLFYGKILKRLGRKGILKSENETAQEFAGRVRTQHPEHYVNVEIITCLYHKVRFGEKKLSEEEKALVSKLVRDPAIFY